MSNSELLQMDSLFDRLFPICRSITGEGLRETLNILSGYIPLEHFGVKSDTEVFDWIIPKEWVIRDAILKGPDNKIIADFKINNLHVLNYSDSVDSVIDLEELQQHLHSIPNLPTAIPYVISYYKRRWGFCISHEEREQLKPGKYHAYIDSEFIDGELNFSHAILPGESKREILISTYVCHPSMANNELSGPISAVFLYQRLARKQRRFTYRFVFLPETIGSISYLHRFGEELRQNIYAGLVLTCLGGNRSLSYKMSRRGDSPIDLMWTHLNDTNVFNGQTRIFTPDGGSDERQYCSPGFNLPVGQMARTVYGEYAGYHNSLDTKAEMTIESLYSSVNEMEILIEAVEWDGYYINNSPYGEVKLDKYGLYPDMNAAGVTKQLSSNNLNDNRIQLSRILNILNYSDGEHTLREIASKCNASILDLIPIVKVLLDKELISGPYDERRDIL
ncbi:aminopeptidase-like protein [Paenibacillus anaericanus]|uniref:DUF4910 domain-containing protein n=1 Tax=Paenibacillus anaericanus TaxID=170367 RepID=UPI00278869C6|nr:DUF4910 domain-containing protein [Paenibacillus anaericanus]MDQ0089902.1 aminopeptidase-like protein [Paenibacillus anaericanus]